MFSDKTVMVLGAGTSRPYGFPTSGELREILLGRGAPVFQKLGFIHSPEAIQKELEKEFVDCAKRQDDLKIFRETFSRSQRVSIDAFAAGRTDQPGFAEIAKKSVAAVLIRCEAHATLDGDWYSWLLEFLIAEGKDFPAGMLSIITFNYDRSLEFYLLRAFEAAFGLSQKEAWEMLARIEIIHVYGSLGPLPGPGINGIRFGDVNQLYVSASYLNLVGPRVEEQFQKRARELMDTAERIIFLGFGFWKENIDALIGAGSMPGAWARKHIFASCFRLWQSKKMEANGRFLYWKDSTGNIRPVINWGTDDQDVFRFVTHWNLKATPPRD